MLSRAVSFIFVLFLCAGVSFASDGALVGHWKLDETSGTVAGDSSGHGNNGTLIEAVPGSLIWEQGRTSGGALRFDGDGPANNTNPACRVSIPTAGMSAARGTVALCVKLDQPPFNVNNRQDLVYFFGLKGPSANDKIKLYVDGNACLRMSVGNYNYTGTAGFRFTRGQWYHIALTWDAGRYVVYINGAALAPVSGSGTYAYFAALPATADIGNKGESTYNQSMHGLIDDVRIYNLALSAAEISALNGEYAWPEKAVCLSPANGAANVNIAKQLSWTAVNATSYDLFFGTAASPSFVDTQTDTTFDPGVMAYNTTYYWRVDAWNALGMTAGDVWSFTTGSPVAVSADFAASVTSGNAPLSVSFTDMSTGDIAQWNWDFGDGQTSNIANPSHQYSTEGTYTVVLTVTGMGGTIDAETKQGYIQVSQAELYEFIPWDVGFQVRSRSNPHVQMGFRFFEHFLFRPDLGTDRARGPDTFYNWSITNNGTHVETSLTPAGELDRPDAASFKFIADATSYGADLTILVTNKFAQPMNSACAIVPCWDPQDPAFSDGQDTRTWFYGYNQAGTAIGWELSKDATYKQASHIWAPLVPYMRTLDPELAFGWWHCSTRFATEGIMTRESRPEVMPGWQAAIAWDRFLIAEGNNPKDCFHLAPRVGPLAPGESRVIKGKIYMIQGTKDDLLEIYNMDFPDAPKD